MFKFGKESAAPEQTGADRENSGNGWLKNHWCALALLVTIVVAFALRTVFAYGISADGNFALSGGSSAQYHLHVVESILNGSFALTDSAVNYPIGGLSVYPPLNDFLAAGVASLLTAFGMGSTEAASAALAVLSPIFGALTCIPVFLIAREMFDRKVAIVAAVILAFLALPINATVFSNGNPYALAMFLVAFMSYFMVKMVKAADADDASRKAVLVNAAIAGVFLLLAALSWNGFRFVAVLIAVAMVAQIVADRLRGRDFTTILLGYTVTMVIGIIVPAVYYIPAGLWDAVFSGPALVAVISLVFSFVFMALRTKPWVLTIPGLVIAFVIVAAVLAFAAPALFEDFVFGNSIYTGLMDSVAGSYVSMSNVSSYYGWVTMWLPICYAIYSLYVYLRRDRSAARLFVTVWMFVMFFAVWTSASNAAVVASVFAVGSAVVIVRVIQAADLKAWWGTMRAAGFPGAIRKLIRPFPLATVIVAVFLIAVPNISYAIDAGISNNDDSEYYFTGNTQYTIKTGDAYSISGVWDQYSGAEKDGALATWIDYTYDAVTQGGFDSVTDTVGGGASAVSQMLLAKGAGGTTAAMMLRIMMSHDTDYSSAFGGNADVYQTVAGYISDPAKAKAEVIANPQTYGYVSSDITDENAVYLASIECITGSMNEYQIMEAYEAVCSASGDKIGYVMMDGSMLPLQYNDGSYFSTLAYFASYSLDQYSAASQFFSYNTYYGYTTYTDAIYDTFLWRSMIGPSASEAGYSSSYSYLVALSSSDGSDGSAMAIPGYGLEGYEVGLWLVRYNANSDATVSDDGWTYMNGYDAIAKQKAEGGVINYLASIVVMEYVGTTDGAVASGSVTTDDGAVDGATVSVYQYSDVYGKYVLYSETRTINGGYTAFVPEGEYMLTVRNGDVVLRSFSSEQSGADNIVIDTTSVEGAVTIGDDVYSGEDMRLVLSGEANVLGTDGKPVYSLDISITDGTINIPSILPGTYSYTLYGESGDSLGTGTITVSTGANVGLTISPTVRTITVTVNDTFGNPATTGVVIATNESTGVQFQADVADGKSVISAISGKYTLSMGEGAVTIYTSTVNVTSGNRTATITAQEARTVTVSGAPEGIVLTASSGTFSTVSYVSEETGNVQFDIPVGLATDNMMYTVSGYFNGQIYHASYAVLGEEARSTDEVTLTADSYVEISGTLKDGDAGASGTVRFVNEATNEVYAVATNSDGEYTALIPAGSYIIAADNGSNKVYYGTFNTSDSDKDLELVDGRRISYTFRYDKSASGSNPYLPFVMGMITFTYNEHTYTLYSMTGTDGVVRFYIPDNVESTISLNNADGTLDNEYFHCVDMKRDVSAGTSNNSETITIDPYKIGEPEEDQEKQYVKPQTVTVDVTMDVVFYDDTDSEVQTINAGEPAELRPGQYAVTIDGSTGHYFDGTAYLYPGQTEFSGLDIKDVTTVTVSRAENTAITIETDGGSYHSFNGGYYFEVGYEYYITVSATGGETGLGYAYVDLTGDTYESSYAFDMNTLENRIEVTGNVGIVADGTITVSYEGVKHQFKVEDGSYTLTLPGNIKSVEATVEVSSTISSEDYYYEATGTLDNLQDGSVRNLPVVSGDAPAADPEEEEEGPTFKVTVSEEKFSNGTGSFTVSVENLTSKTVTYNIAGGSALTLFRDYSVVVEAGQTGSVNVEAFYDATRFAPGSDGFSVTVSDISGANSETVDITGGADASAATDCGVYLSGQDGSKFNDRVSAYEYMFAVTVKNNNVYSHDVAVTVANVPAGWSVTLMNEDGTVVADNGGTITVYGLQTSVVYVKMMLLGYDEGTSTDVPAVTASISIDGAAQDYQLEPKNASVTGDSMSATGDDVFNERSGIPSGIWFLVAVIILLLVIVFWLASKRGVFSRR